VSNFNYKRFVTYLLTYLLTGVSFVLNTSIAHGSHWWILSWNCRPKTGRSFGRSGHLICTTTAAPVASASLSNRLSSNAF